MITGEPASACGASARDATAPFSGSDRRTLIAQSQALQRRWEETVLPQFVERVLAIRLTTQQLKVLALIVPDTDGKPLRELAEMMNVSMPTMSGIVDRLSEHEMVQRVADPDDQRVRRIVATAPGRDAFRRLAAANPPDGALPLERLSLDDLRALVQGMTALMDVLHPDN